MRRSLDEERHEEPELRRLSALQRDRDVTTELGTASVLGIPHDASLAAHWYRSAAQLDDPSVMVHLVILMARYATCLGRQHCTVVLPMPVTHGHGNLGSLAERGIGFDGGQIPFPSLEWNIMRVARLPSPWSA